MTQNKLYLEAESYRIRGAIFEVYREKGCGFHEAVYQECLEKEFKLADIPFQSQPEVKLSYKGQPLDQTYRPDFIGFGEIIIELKALSKTAPEHEAQVINYLKATGFKVGFLVNFGAHPKAKIQRIVR